jgi:hypothetical protein
MWWHAILSAQQPKELHEHFLLSLYPGSLGPLNMASKDETFFRLVTPQIIDAVLNLYYNVCAVLNRRIGLATSLSLFLLLFFSNIH